ncbi:eukaryotic translation initiation factor 3 subunit J-A-like [Gadus macrocephalus]|uniref:eukaryotic translation initiation factor 3 subunit J-A-like n=1 Tax=Gadus macrocephalus TaxID=80720 RepID=UPI0028CB9FA3|nr:eukaryotic translation initiation factor 3 subunit J-A-like [Gadus macrocephalus]
MCTRMGTVMLLGPVGRNTCKMAEIDDWDADDLATEEQPKKTAEVDNWDDEDVDDDPKDSWADEEAELKREEPQKTEIVTSEKKKQSEKEKEQEEVKERSEDNEEGAELTPEEGSETGEQQEKPAVEPASGATAVAGVPGGIDAMSPSSKEDFSEFEKVLKDKLCPYEGSVHYSGLLESLFQDLCISMEIEDLKKINSSLTSLLSEKQKQEKQLNKGKKKKKGAVTVGGMKAKLKDDLADYGQFEGGYTQDYEDFM